MWKNRCRLALGLSLRVLNENAALLNSPKDRLNLTSIQRAMSGVAAGDSPLQKDGAGIQVDFLGALFDAASIFKELGHSRLANLTHSQGLQCLMFSASHQIIDLQNKGDATAQALYGEYLKSPSTTQGSSDFAAYL